MHLEPPNGLLNDPNGLIYYQDHYYFFHQWNPKGCNHDYKCWGLFISPDLINWTHHETNLIPDSKEDSHGVYSGSAIDYQGQLFLFYTGNTKMNGNRKSFQKKAIMEHQSQFIKQKGFETPTGLTEHHRDPNVKQMHDEYWMVVGSQTKEGMGAVALYTSKDIGKWQYQGIFYQSSDLEQMCECPDLIDFGDQQVLLVCPQKRDLIEDKDLGSYSGYYVGQVSHYQFQPTQVIQPVDYGFDFYAPQTFNDPKGRKILVGWMSRMNEQEEQWCPTKKWGYLHCLTLPREIQLKDGQLYQSPVVEIFNRRQLIKEQVGHAIDTLQENQVMVIEIKNQNLISDVHFQLANGQVFLDYQDNLLILSRKNWVSNHFEERSLVIQELSHLNIIIDQSAIEIFINDGQYVMSSRYFVEAESRVHKIISNEKLNVKISVIE